jgi:Transposase DDE domain
LTPGQRHEAVVFPQLMAGGAVKRGGLGRPKHRPQCIVGDKAYSSRQIQQYVRRHGIRIPIPRKSNEHRTGPFDRTSYRQRNKIERLINRYKQFRRIATRYEKRAASDHVAHRDDRVRVGLCKYALVSQIFIHTPPGM